MGVSEGDGEGVGVSAGVGEGVGVGAGVGVGKLITTIVSLRASAPSLAASSIVYVPSAEKEAVVLGAVASTNVTRPGPLTLLQV